MIWGKSADESARTLDTHVWRLRSKLGDFAERKHQVVVSYFDEVDAVLHDVDDLLFDVDVAISCGGVTVFPGDQVAADEDGVAICPKQFATTVLPDAAEQDRVERYIRQRVAAGEGLVGLYPMNEAVVAAYKAWVAAGEPAIRVG